MKAVIYTRVSTEEQVQGYSLESQKESCVTKANELGVTRLWTYEEAGVSGAVQNRPALLDAVATAHEQKADYFVCYDPDRLSRDLGALLAFTSEIERRGTKLIYVNFNRENTPEGNLMYAVRGAVSEFEKELIRRRTMGGKLKKAREHKWTHWPDIYGYNYADGEVFVNDEEANVVRMIFNLASEIGVVPIVNRLAQLGIRSPRKKSLQWSKTTIRRILANESYYTGKTYIRKYETSGVHLNKYLAPDERVHRSIRPKDEWVDMKIPPLISEDEFKKAAKRMENAKRRNPGNAKMKFLLSGLLRCEKCGKTWHGHSYMRSGKRVSYYVCTWKCPGPPKASGAERCPTKFIPTEIIDRAVWSQVKDWLMSDAAVEEYQITLKANEQNSLESEQIEMLEERRKTLNEEENSLIERLGREKNERVKAKIEDRLGAVSQQIDELDQLLEQLTVLRREQAVTELDTKVISAFRGQYPNPDSLDQETQSEIIHRLIREIRVSLDDNNQVSLVLKPL